MNNSKKVLLFSATMFLFTACTTTQKLSPTPSVEQIEQNKHFKNQAKVKISDQTGYKAYIDDDNDLRYICMSTNALHCNYYSKEKHSYNDGTPDEEYVWINRDGYYPPLSPYTSGVQCGTGSLFGWLAIFPVEPFGITNYTKKHPVVCNSRFTQVDSTQLGARIGIGLITFGTPLITGGTMHTKKFDKKKFIDVIYASNIETFRKKLLDMAQKYSVDGGIDVIYIEKGDVADDLEDKYESLLKDKSLKAGLIFLEEDTNKLLSIDIFNKYKSKNIISSISLQMEDILHDIAKNNQYILKYEDIIPYIPKEIALPKIPPVKKLVKDEFETKKEFEARVQNAVEMREKKIRALQREYSLKVFERNSYIDSLQKAYKEYLKNQAESKNVLLHEMKENIPLLSKILFLENTSGYGAKDFRYDAEEQKLYFTIYSKKGGFSQDVVASIPPNDAKSIKLKRAFKVIPEISFENNKLILRGFSILDTDSDNQYKINYTNINYKPESVSLRVVSAKESIKKEINNYFKKYKQRDKKIVDTSKKEIWYIDIVKNINAKIPKWFSAPSTGDKIIGYGEGKTLKEAKAKARDELAYMINVKVNTQLTQTNEINNFKSFSEVKNQTRQSSNVDLSSKDYKLYKQERRDGIWYVGFEYLKDSFSN
ncbi:hypothetical protein MNB_SM-6-1431 [hydrothermal vent metagenome]|uniref:Lipoprotein LPP20-like domain-containing protein n=1 Tax=hydrothermal vent metagenome TaxID=652676 RepID=A0A1W1C127_9ZZZZ